MEQTKETKEDPLDRLGSNRMAGYQNSVSRSLGVETKLSNPAKNDPERDFIEL